MKRTLFIAASFLLLLSNDSKAQSLPILTDTILKMTILGNDTVLKKNKTMSIFQYNTRNELIQKDNYRWMENVKKWDHHSRSKISYHNNEIVERYFTLANEIEIKGYTKKFKLDNSKNIIEITKEKTYGADIILFERLLFSYKNDSLTSSSSEYRSTTFFKQNERQISYLKDEIATKINTYVEAEPGKIHAYYKRSIYNKSKLIETRLEAASASNPDTLVVYDYNGAGPLKSDTTKLISNRLRKSSFPISTSQYKYDAKGKLKECQTIRLNKDGSIVKQFPNEITYYSKGKLIDPNVLKPDVPKLETFITD